MSKFIYEEGDLQVGDSQCSLCIHFEEACKSCKIKGNIPKEILSDEVTCQEFEYEDEEI